jgi:hypothetical protein
MPNLRLFSIIAWIALPTVMYGGYALLGLLTRGGLTPFQQTFFRAGHAHAGVLLLLSLLYHSYLEQTNLRPRSRSEPRWSSSWAFWRSPAGFSCIC